MSPSGPNGRSPDRQISLLGARVVVVSGVNVVVEPGVSDAAEHPTEIRPIMAITAVKRMLRPYPRHRVPSDFTNGRVNPAIGVDREGRA